MNGTLLSRIIPSSVFAGALLIGSLSHAQTYQVDDWYVVAANATSVSNGGTSTATINYTGTGQNAAQTTAWSYFDAVSLNDQQKLRFSATMTVDLVAAQAGSVASGLRFGLFDSKAEHPTDRIVSAEDGAFRNGWDGGVFVNTGNATVYRKNQPNNSSFIVTSDTTTGTLDAAIANHRFVDMVGVEMVLELTRSGNDLILGGSFAGSEIAGIFANYFADGVSNTFDSFGFFLGSQGVGGAANSITFSDANVQLVPEPAVVGSVLAAVALVGVMALRRRRARA